MQLYPANPMRNNHRKNLLMYMPGRQDLKASCIFLYRRAIFFITPLLIEINVAIFIIMVASGVNLFAPDGPALIPWGANFKPLVLGGEWWRLFTCMFLHFGILHIALNMYALFFIGVYLEPLLGRLRFATAYLAAGLLSSVASTWWHDGGIVGAGASGAIFGLYGVFLALLTTNVVDSRARQSLLGSVGIFVAYNLFYGFSHKEVDNSAHIGGLVAGLVIGYILYFSLREPSDSKNRKVSAIIATLALVVTLLYLGGAKKDDNYRFDQQFSAFIDLQTTALAPLQNDSLPIPEAARLIKETSLPAWKKAQQLIDSTSTFKLTGPYERKRHLARQYVQLRIQHAELLLQMFDSGDGDAEAKYKEPVEALTKKMNEVVEEMNKLNKQ